jgi:hypothetical protein
MRKLIAATAVVAGLMFNVPARATVTTGEVLNRTCTSTNVDQFVGYCLGFVIAAMEMWNFIELDKDKCLFSLPDKATPDQLIAVVTKYLKGHPEEWDKPAIGTVMVALRDAWPCEPGQKKVPAP